jgi:transcriptional regulator GlxA family with amidase domain
VLDGLRATRHWAHTDALAARYPRVEVDPDVLYVDNGRVLASAGKAAAIDLCLHLIRRDHGSTVANAVARAGQPTGAPSARPDPSEVNANPRARQGRTRGVSIC